jgi:hypothetical protein
MFNNFKYLGVPTGQSQNGSVLFLTSSLVSPLLLATFKILQNFCL